MCMIIKRIIDGLKRRYTWYVLLPAIKRKYKDIKILDSITSINYILEHRCSVSRFGDGEFDIIEGRKEGYQEPNERLAQLLKQVLQSNLPNHMVGIPRPLIDTSMLKKESKEFWERYFLVYHGECVRKYFSSNKTYLDTQLSRFYIEKIDKEYSKTIFAHLRRIWDKQDIVIVEGVKTRSGVGNDLYDNANSIQRILGPATNAIDKYDEMLSAIRSNVSKERLILLSFGPTATVLAYDLAKLGYWAIDIGHLDIEYEWMRRNVQSEIVIKGKYTNEAKGGDVVDECDDALYKSQIICDITK